MARAIAGDWTRPRSGRTESISRKETESSEADFGRSRGGILQRNPPDRSKHSETCVRLSGSSGLIRTEKFQVSADSAAVPKLSAKCCAANVAHSSQMKTLLLSGPRLERKASQPPQPPMRDRTSCRDLPQNEHVLHGSTLRVTSEISSVCG